MVTRIVLSSESYQYVQSEAQNTNCGSHHPAVAKHPELYILEQLTIYVYNS